MITEKSPKRAMKIIREDGLTSFLSKFIRFIYRTKVRPTLPKNGELVYNSVVIGKVPKSDRYFQMSKHRPF